VAANCQGTPAKGGVTTGVRGRAVPPTRTGCPPPEPSACPSHARSSGKSRALAATPDSHAGVQAWIHAGGADRRASLIKKRSTHGRLLPTLLPNHWTTSVTRRQVWNIGPERRHAWTILDDLPRTTDQRVMPATCPTGWSLRDHHGHSRTDQQACRPGFQQVAPVAGTSLIRKRSVVQVHAGPPSSKRVYP
jgi:hypothetical protein